MGLETFLTLSITAFVLTFTRIGTALMVMPGIGDSFVPTRVRLLFALAFAFVMTPITIEYMPEPLPTGFRLYMLILFEAVIGFLIGAVARIFVAALDTAGMIISFHTGLANAQLFNPAFSTQGSLIGAFFTILGVTLLFTTELYAILIYGLVESYTIFPMGGIPPTDDMALIVSKAVAGSFRVGFQIAVPFMTIALMLFIGMGVLSRLMPQVQVFILSIPIQILLSLLTMTLVLSTGMIYWLNYYRDNITFFFSN